MSADIPETPTIPVDRAYYAGILPPHAYDDRQPALPLPELQTNWGFAIDRLEQGEYHGPADTSEIFSVTKEQRRVDMVRRLNEGDDVRVLAPNENPSHYEASPLVLHSEWIDWDQYEPKLQAGRVPDPFFSFGLGFAQYLDGTPGADDIAREFPLPDRRTLVRDKLESGAEDYQLDSIYGVSPLQNEHLSVHEAVKRAPQVTEIFEFSMFGETVRAYNFSNTRLSPMQLEQMANAMRATGGKLMQTLKVMAIFPSGTEAPQDGPDTRSEDEKFWDRYWKQGGQKAWGRANTYNGYVEFNEAALQEEAVPSSEATDSYGVGGGSFEALAYHEFFHMLDVAHALGDRGASLFYESLSEAARRSEPASKYAKDKPQFEDGPEAATALHFGGEWAERVDDERFVAFMALLQKLRSKAGDVQGPAYIQCREIDPKSEEAKDGKYPKKPVAFRLNTDYRIRQKPKTPAGVS